MQALRPGPEWRFRVPVQSTDSGTRGVSKKRSVVSGASFQEHHFKSIISRTSFREDKQNSQHVACLPLSLSPCRILSCRDQALLLSWASSGSSGQKASCFLCTRGSFLMDTGKNNRKYNGVQTCFLPERHTSFCPCQGLSGLSGQRPPLPDRTEPPCAGIFPRNVFCSLPGTGRKECAFGKIFRCIEIFT